MKHISLALLLLLLASLAPAQTQNAQTQNTSVKKTSPPTYVVTTLPAYWSGETGIGWAIKVVTARSPGSSRIRITNHALRYLR